MSQAYEVSGNVDGLPSSGDRALADRLGRIVSITRPAQIGGTIHSTLRQADAEFRRGRRIEVWSLLQRQRERFGRLASDFSVPAQQISNATFVRRVLLSRLSSDGIGMMHLHSGRAQASSKLKLFRWLAGPRTPIIVSLHGPTGGEHNIDKAWIDHHLECVRYATAIAVPSSMEREVQIGFGIEPERVFVVPDIIMSRTGQRGELRARLGLDEVTPIIGFVGRIIPQKAPRVLLRAFARIANTFPSVALAIAGEGRHLDLCRDLAAKLDIDDRVHFLGHLDDPGILYSDVDVFVAPSAFESFGITAMEAALSRVPLVLSRISPWIELFEHERHCLFADVGDDKELAVMIGRALSNRDSAAAMAIEAESLVRGRFSEDSAITALDQVYEYALAARGVR